MTKRCLIRHCNKINKEQMAASQRVGPAGRIHAIDLSAKMISQAEKNVSKMKLTNVDFHLMDAANLEF